MMKLKVVRADRLPPDPVAFLCPDYGCVYIPKLAKEGGGCWHSNGQFTAQTFFVSLFTNTKFTKYEPLYAGDRLEIVKEVVLL